MKKEIYFNETGFNQHIESESAFLCDFNSLLSAYNEMALPELTESEFLLLFSNDNSVMIDKITGGIDLMVGPFKVAKEKVLDTIEKPGGYNNFISLLNEMKQKSNHEYYLSTIALTAGEIVLNPTVINKIKEQYKFYATTDNQLKAYEFAKAVLEKSNEIFGEGKIHISDTLSALIDSTNFNHSVNRNSFLNYRGILAYGEPYS